MKKIIFINLTILSLLSANYDDIIKQKYNPKNVNQVNSKIINSSQYKELMSNSSKMKNSMAAIKTPEVAKVIKILKKLADLEQDAIDNADFEQISSYNRLRKCLLNSETKEDIDSCKSDFKNNN